MWELDYKKSWVLKNWCFWTVVLEKTLESPLGSKEIQSVHPKGNQSWTFIGRTDAEAETPILWPLDSKSWLVRKDPDAWKDWRQEEKGMTDGEMVGWHHRLHGLEFEQALGVGDWQGSLACCSLWDCKESNTTEQLAWEMSAIVQWLAHYLVLPFLGISMRIDLHGSLPCHGEGACVTRWSYEPCCVGPPKIMGQSTEFWQNVIHWRKEWQTAPIYFLWESHEPYKSTKCL